MRIACLGDTLPLTFAETSSRGRRGAHGVHAGPRADRARAGVRDDLMLVFIAAAGCVLPAVLIASPPPPRLADATASWRHTTTPPARGSWYALHADRDLNLTNCAKKGLGGSLCTQGAVFPITFFGVPAGLCPAGASCPASTVSWWAANTTGAQVCSKLGPASCTQVVDFNCHKSSPKDHHGATCNATAGHSDAVLCAGPPPGPPPPSPPVATPASHGCRPGSPSVKLPFCNSKLSTATRTRDLVGRMTRAEKCFMTGDGATVGGCGIPRLGVEKYSWNTEALHGLGAKCFNQSGVVRCPTVFPAPPGMGATFNLTLAEKMGEIISDEARALNNLGGCRHRNSKEGCNWHDNWFIGLNVWVPNLNIYRDPRWGRNVEVPSEDPFHSGEYGTAVVRGVQWSGGVDDVHGKTYTKINAALKHFFAYSVETGRGSRNFNISQHDIADTYLPSFEAPIVKADAKGYMCSYASVNGVASCGSKFLSDTARNEWNFTGYIVSDCGGVGDIRGYEHVNDTMAAAIGLRDGGVDINCGSGLTPHICDAIDEGLVNISVLDASLQRSLGLLFDAGMFDPLESQPYTNIGFDAIGSDKAKALVQEASAQAMVLLKNDAKALPLAKSDRIALLGPHAITSGELGGNYFEDICGDVPETGSCVPSMNTSITAVSGIAPILSGCLDGNYTHAINATQHADVVVLALGLTSGSGAASSVHLDGPDWHTSVKACATTSEGEGHDRMDIQLPSGQRGLLEAVLAHKPPRTKVIVVLFNGGGLAIDDLMATDSGVSAIIEAFYPGVAGAMSLARTLYGESNRFSKLPYTLLGKVFMNESDFFDMNMTSGNGNGPGRSYKYYMGNATLAPFGYGLSYTTFSLSGAVAGLVSRDTVSLTTGEVEHLAAGPRQQGVLRGGQELLTASVTVTNTGTVVGDEVVFLFRNSFAATSAWGSRVGSDGPDPQAIKELVAFERVTLAPSESKTVTFPLSLRSLSTVDKHGVRHTLAGEHELRFSRGHGDEITTHVALRLPGGRVVLQAAPQL